MFKFKYVLIWVFAATTILLHFQIYSVSNRLSASVANLRLAMKRVKLDMGLLSSNIVSTKNSYEKDMGVLNSRVGIVLNSTNVKDKRKHLIKSIRGAISDNITHTIPIRDLNRISNAVIDYSYQYNLKIPNVLAQIKVESDFKYKAVSSAGAQGLMQIMPRTLEYISYDMHDRTDKLNTWNVYHNIKAGCFYMAQQIEEFANYDDALRAYNWGPRNLKRFIAGERKTMPEETINYVIRNAKYTDVFTQYGLE